MFEVLDRVECLLSEVATVGTIRKILRTDTGWSYVIRLDDGLMDTWAEVFLCDAFSL